LAGHAGQSIRVALIVHRRLAVSYRRLAMRIMTGIMVHVWRQADAAVCLERAPDLW
jgi:hypothetical protein